MAKKNISPNQQRMHSYAKGGGLNGSKNGRSVLDEAQLGTAIKAIAKGVKKVIPKVKKFITDLSGTTVDKELLKNTGYARKIDLERGIKNRAKGTGSN